MDKRVGQGVGDSNFFFNDTATTEIYTLSLHDALPICYARSKRCLEQIGVSNFRVLTVTEGGEQKIENVAEAAGRIRSEEHTSELQSRQYLVCRLLLEKKKSLDRGVPPVFPLLHSTSFT